MKLKVEVLVNKTLEIQLRERTARQTAGLKKVMTDSARRVVMMVADSTPRDTHYMAEHLDERPTHGGLGYLIGWWRSDFVGKENPATEQIITTFYPYYVIHGARGIMGRDPLTPALRTDTPRLEQEAARALSG